jgi:hypothetical protein
MRQEREPNKQTEERQNIHSPHRSFSLFGSELNTYSKGSAHFSIVVFDAARASD